MRLATAVIAGFCFYLAALFVFNTVITDTTTSSLMLKNIGPIAAGTIVLAVVVVAMPH